MATIQSTIQINDKFSKALRSLSSGLDGVIHKLNKVESAANKISFSGFQRTDSIVNSIEKGFENIASLLERIDNNIDDVNSSLYESNRTLDDMSNELYNSVTGLDLIDDTLDKINLEQNKINNATENHKRQIDNANRSLFGMWGNVKRIAATWLSFQSIKTLVNGADAYINATSKLGLIEKDAKSVAALQDRIYESAQRTYSSYTDMSNAVAKLGILAGKSFTDNDEIVKFAELIQKQFTIAGASVQEKSAAMYQLTQAMASNSLKGDEFASILENAPLITQTISEALGVTSGKLKDMAREGLITADVIKNAIFGAADDIDKKFSKVSLTFGALWTQAINKINMALRPLYERMKELFNSEKFHNFLNNLIDGFLVLIAVGAQVFDFFVGIAEVIYDNWSLIEPIIWGIVAALGVYYAVQAIGLAKSAVGWIIATYSAISYQWALFKMAVAQYGFNAALAMCPLTWFLYAIIAIIVVIYLAVAAFNKLAGTSYSVIGLIAGAVLWLAALIGNIVIFVINLFSMLVQFIGVCLAWVVDKFIAGFTWIYNIASGCCQWIAAAFGWLKDNLGIIFDNIGIFWSNLWISCQQMFYKFLNAILSGISKLATPLKALAKLFGFDLGGAFDNMKAGLDGKVAELEGQKKEYLKTTSFKEAVGEVDWNTKKYDSDFSFKESVGKIDTSTIDYFNLGNAFDKGYDWGANLGDKISSKFDPSKYGEIGENASTFDKIMNGIDKSVGVGKQPSTGTGGKGGSGLGGSPKTDDLLKQIADNTAGTNDELMRNNADMSYLRDLAERKAINKISDIKVKVDMTNNNTVNSDFDLDKIADYLGEKVFNTITSSAAGVYY